MTDIPPLTPRREVLDFLATRRSRPAKTLSEPVPDRATLEPILEMALRAPDHGKLEPWKLIVLGREALDDLAGLTVRLGAERGMETSRLEKDRATFASAPLMVAVVAQTVDSPKVPEVEQVLSAGAVCLGLCNAAQASGWGANWLTGWMATDRTWLDDGLGLASPDFVAGFVVIGTEGPVPPERPRPDLSAKVEWRG